MREDECTYPDIHFSVIKHIQKFLQDSAIPAESLSTLISRR
jgi:hypothetical protein